MKLRYGYFISGTIIGIILLLSFLSSLPDGKLRVVFCDVGQGDAIYIRFPDGRDGLIDGGPNTKSVINCLSQHMPFWDRTIDIIANTHPQKDHMEGLVEVLKRYQVNYIVTNGIDPGSETFKTFKTNIQAQKTQWKSVVSGEKIIIGNAIIEVLWPSQTFVNKGNASYASNPSNILGTTSQIQTSVFNPDGILLPRQPAGAQNDKVKSSFDLNTASVVFLLSYGTFDVLLTGDADRSVQDEFMNEISQDNPIEILKVPHHGSKTGLLDTFFDRLHTNVAVISVGKNSYGHPADEILKKLQERNIAIHRTDTEGDIEVVSDGRGWRVISNKQIRRQSGR